MRNLLEQLNLVFLAFPGVFVVAGVMLLLLLVGLILWVMRRQRLSNREWLLQQLQAQDALHEERDEDLREFQRGEFRALNAVRQQHLQTAQSLLAERVSKVETAVLKDMGSLRLDLVDRFEELNKALREDLGDTRLQQQRSLAELRQQIGEGQSRHREAFETLQREAISKQQETLATTLHAMSQQIQEAFRLSSEELGKRVEGLTRTTDERLKDISGQVEKRLADGFEKTTETFTRVLEHLSRIDEAQKKITELSGNVVSLQEVLTDKRSRGAFGEVQLAALVRNVMPEDSFELQATLSNGKRVDCLLRLPDPTGKVPIDAKFPLESYQRMQDFDLPDAQRATAATQFRRDIRKHIGDIAGKYLIQGETADGAVMFIPAEAIFAEIHAHFPELVEEAQRARVWLVSPTTLMAVLTTARAVLKDEATRRQVHIIQDHLRRLSEDFGRFQGRMDKLAQHIRQAHDDVKQVNTSAKKISGRFRDIDQVQLPEPEAEPESADEMEAARTRDPGAVS